MRELRGLAGAVYAVGWIAMLLGFAVGSESTLAAATIAIGLGYTARDYLADRPDSITIMTVYVFFSVFHFGIGNLIGFNAESGPYDALFNQYNVPEYHFTAQVIATLGLVVPLLGYEGLKHQFARRPVPVPKIGFDFTDRGLLVFCMVALAAAWIVKFGQIDLGGLGTVGGVVATGSLATIFIVQSRWTVGGHALPAWSRWIPPVVMVVDAIYNAMFEFLRITVLWPIVAFCVPYGMHKRLTPGRLALALVLVATFVIAFRPLGEFRRTLSGGDRIAVIAQNSPLRASEDYDEDDNPGAVMTVLARLSSYNQISQVVRITEEEGYYGGATLSYVAYVFVPRFLWPEKPLITPGQWFASKLGLGRFVSDTRFSNAIDMTIPGEFYLNFGWLGVVLGLLLVSALYFFFWAAAGFHRSTANPLGQSFACLLIMQAAFNGSDVAALVTLVTWYVIYFGITRLLGAFVRRRRVEGGDVFGAPVQSRADGIPSRSPKPVPGLLSPRGPR